MPAENRSLSGYWNRYHWLRVAFAGLLGFAVTLFTMEIISIRAVSLTPLSIALAAVSGSLLGISLVGSLSAWGIRRKLASQNVQLDAALNNMIQGLCMFDAQNRLLVWNERYRAMYNIDPEHIWRGCTIRDLLDARIAAGTFPLDPARYDADLRAAVTRGNTFVVTVELADGRIIDVVNQPTKDGGWVAMHEDITERRKAERELEHTRTFPQYHHRERAVADHREGHSGSEVFAGQPRRREISGRRPRVADRQGRCDGAAESQRAIDRGRRPKGGGVAARSPSSTSTSWLRPATARAS